MTMAIESDAATIPFVPIHARQWVSPGWQHVIYAPRDGCYELWSRATKETASPEDSHTLIGEFTRLEDATNTATLQSPA
jgi:hypothetical protein